MKKSATKKSGAKTTRKPAEKKKYSMVIEFNGELFLKKTNDIQKTIMSVKPESLMTEMYISINGTSPRRLSALQGKRMFGNENVLEVFTNNLLMELS